MKYQRYGQYSDSGHRWLGFTPMHWDTLALKWMIAQKITDGPHVTPAFIDEGMPFLSVDGIQDGELVFDSCRYISQQDHQEFRRKAAPERDDILMGKAASTGKIARVKVDFEFSIWSPLALIRVTRSTCSPAFVEYALKSAPLQAQIDVLCTSNTQKNISMDDIPKLILCAPAIDEQLMIVAFLDREIAKIDTLIAKQDRLIALLQEKRQALISHVVTKGLNSDAPMKESGIEWLGKIPMHWKVVQSRRLFALRKSTALPSDQQLTAAQKYGVIYQDDFVEREGRRVVQVIKGGDILKHVEPNDFVISMRSFQGGIEGCKYRGSISSAYVVLIPSELVDFDYFTYMFKSEQYIQALQSTTNLVRDGQALRYSNFTLVDLPLVPLEEQRQIAIFLGEETKKIDALIEKSNRFVDLLKERRSALISAAVTGKIDVRNMVS